MRQFHKVETDVSVKDGSEEVHQVTGNVEMGEEVEESGEGDQCHHEAFLVGKVGDEVFSGDGFHMALMVVLMMMMMQW